jgi:hypothetical protein
MGGARNTHQDGEKRIPHFSQNILREGPLGRPEVRWNDKRVIREGLRDTGCEFNHDGRECNMGFMWGTLINPRVPLKTGKLLGFLR